MIARRAPRRVGCRCSRTSSKRIVATCARGSATRFEHRSAASPCAQGLRAVASSRRRRAMSIVRATGGHESAREARLAVGRDRAAAGQRANATVAAGRAAAAPERPVRGRQLRAQGGTIIKHDGSRGPGFSLGWSDTEGRPNGPTPEYMVMYSGVYVLVTVTVICALWSDSHACQKSSVVVCVIHHIKP